MITGDNIMYNILYVGLDDTDSPQGMCTTYICAVVIDKLKDYGFNLKGLPRLIRLNPFAPHKTRGNGAISFRVIINTDEEGQLARNIILETVEELSRLEDSGTNPGVVFYEGQITSLLTKFARKTIQNIVTREEAELVAHKIGAEIHKYKNGRGIIGALASIGCVLSDKTYELLTYREPVNYGKPRKIVSESVYNMNKMTYPETFDNIDEGYLAIEPHSPCPVLYGIRGETESAVIKGYELVKVEEPIERLIILETNQHTDMHLQEADKIKDMKKYQCYIVKGQVKEKPYPITGGHILFTLKDESGEIPCAAYEPTKQFREIIRELLPEDRVRVYGGIGEKGTLNLEKIQILELAQHYKTLNPICECGKRMKSAGKDKGFKCPKCGKKLKDKNKEKIPIERNIKVGFYEVPPSARRHLSKPLIRML